MKRFLALALLYLGSLVPAGATVSCALPFTLVNNTVADANQVMANYNALVNCFTQTASAGVNSDITALNALATPITPGQGGTNVFIGGTSTGSANAQVLATTTPNTFVLTAGYRAVFLAGFTNTGATQLNIRATGLTDVFKMTPTGPVALTGNEIVANQLVEVVYDGTRYQLLSVVVGLNGGFGPLTNLSSAATTDLGTVPSHNVAVTGNVGITSFGSSASTTFPIYRIIFTGTLTLTHNATSLILPGTANITTAPNDTAVALYLGVGNWQIISYARANGTSVVAAAPNCGANGLVFANNAGTPNTNIDYSAASVVLVNPTGNVPIYGTSVSGTINTTVGTVTSTVDGMDGEARPTSAWGFLYLISNGTTFGGLVATSPTNPQMPAGYTYRCRMGAWRFDGSQNALRQRIAGRDFTYTPVVATNTAAFPAILSTSAQTWPQTISVSAFVPSTASRIRLIIACTTNCTIAASSTPQTSGSTFSATAPSECFRTDVTSWYMQCQLSLNGGTNIFVGASNAGTWGIAAEGFQDAVNAN